MNEEDVNPRKNVESPRDGGELGQRSTPAPKRIKSKKPKSKKPRSNKSCRQLETTPKQKERTVQRNCNTAGRGEGKEREKEPAMASGSGGGR